MMRQNAEALFVDLAGHNGAFNPDAGDVGFSRRLFFVIPSVMDIEVKFDGTEIIVTRPGTDFMLAFRPHDLSATIWSLAPVARSKTQPTSRVIG